MAFFIHKISFSLKECLFFAHSLVMFNPLQMFDSCHCLLAGYCHWKAQISSALCPDCHHVCVCSASCVYGWTLFTLSRELYHEKTNLITFLRCCPQCPVFNRVKSHVLVNVLYVLYSLHFLTDFFKSCKQCITVMSTHV